jgi:hypothetical protein
MRPLALVFVSLSLILCLISTTTNNWYERIEDNYNSGLFFKCLRLSSFICNRISYIHSVHLNMSEKSSRVQIDITGLDLFDSAWLLNKMKEQVSLELSNRSLTSILNLL